MNNSEYQQKIEQTLLVIEEAIEDMLQETDMDLDYESAGGILTIDLGAGGKLILNQQEPLQQLWLAAKSGGYHLDWKDGEWYTDRENESLHDLFNRVFTEQTGVNGNFQFDY